MGAYSTFQSIWAVIGLWCVLYIGDYYLTLYTARLFKGDVGGHFDFGGSFELNPLYEDEVEAARSVSPKFIAVLILSTVIIISLWYLADLFDYPYLFDFIYGGLICSQGVVHLRHYRNLAMAKVYRQGAITGRITYERWFILKHSAWDIFAAGIFFLFLALIEKSWFLAGGFFSCSVLALQQGRLGNKKKPPMADS